MGNWKTVQIIGTCAENDIKALWAALDPGNDYRNFHCLCATGSLCGLPNWGMANISVVGNLAERGYSVIDVARQLEKLATVAPSLKVKIHCGGDHESIDCVATIMLENGVVTICPPEIAQIKEIPESQMAANLFAVLLMKRKADLNEFILDGFEGLPPCR